MKTSANLLDVGALAQIIHEVAVIGGDRLSNFVLLGGEDVAVGLLGVVFSTSFSWGNSARDSAPAT